MKRILFFLAVVTSLGLTACSGAEANAETEIWVSGYCDMCKEKIEGALNEVNGVASATWDVDSKMATVKYDKEAVQPQELHQAIAHVGYSTKEVNADPAAYDALPKCCKKPEDR